MYDGGLYQFFQRNGFKPHSARVILDKQTKNHKGFGYVTFNAKQDAAAAMEKLNNMQLEGKRIRIMWADNQHDYNKEANLVVKNIDASVT